MTIRINHTATLSLLLCSLAGAQSTDKTPPPSGVTAGIVEAVIGNGDLLPARFAKILALPSDKAASTKSALQTVSNYVDELRAKDSSIGEAGCIQALITLKPSIVAARGSSGALAADADETGEFTLRGLLNQTYTVIAIGRFGMNAALWLEDLAPSKQADRLKLVRPIISCYDPNSYFKM